MMIAMCVVMRIEDGSQVPTAEYFMFYLRLVALVRLTDDEMRILVAQ